MAAGKVEAYYWEIYALIFESEDIVALDAPGFSLSDEDVASIEQAIHAVLPFRDHSRLYAEIRLAANGETIEEQYAYIYYDSGDQRILQYDNRPSPGNLDPSTSHAQRADPRCRRERPGVAD